MCVRVRARAQGVPITLDGLALMMSREGVQEPPQSYVKTFAYTPGAASEASEASTSGAGGVNTASLSSSERVITNWPHPHPQVCTHALPLWCCMACTGLLPASGKHAAQPTAMHI